MSDKTYQCVHCKKKNVFKDVLTDDSKAKLSLQSTKHKELKKEYDKLKTNYESCQGLSTEMFLKNSELKNEMEKLKTLISEFEKTTEELKRDLQDKDKSMSSLSDEYEELVKIVEKKEEELKKLLEDKEGGAVSGSFDIEEYKLKARAEIELDFKKKYEELLSQVKKKNVHFSEEKDN